MQQAICHAVVAAIPFDSSGVEAFLDILDAKLGRLFKNRLPVDSFAATLSHIHCYGTLDV